MESDAKKLEAYIAYKQRLAMRVLELMKDLKLINKELLIGMRTSDVEELGKSIVPAYETLKLLKEKRKEVHGMLEKERQKEKEMERQKEKEKEKEMGKWRR